MRVSMSPSSKGHVNMMKGQPFFIRNTVKLFAAIFDWALLVFRLGAYSSTRHYNVAFENF